MISGFFRNGDKTCDLLEKVGWDNSVRVGRSGDQIPVGSEIFRTCPDWPWGPPRLLYNGYRFFPGGKERPGRDADPSPLLVPSSWKSRAIPLLPLWAVRPVQSFSVCTRVHFTFTFFWKITQLVLVNPYRLFGTTFWSHLQGLWNLGFLDPDFLDPWSCDRYVVLKRR